jgi:hypothetical protein
MYKSPIINDMFVVHDWNTCANIILYGSCWFFCKTNDFLSLIGHLELPPARQAMSSHWSFRLDELMTNDDKCQLFGNSFSYDDLLQPSDDFCDDSWIPAMILMANVKTCCLPWQQLVKTCWWPWRMHVRPVDNQWWWHWLPLWWQCPVITRTYVVVVLIKR